MKPVHFIAPAIALAIAGGLVSAQLRTISSLENESVLLSKRIAAEKVSIARQQVNAARARPAKPGGADQDIDWAEFVQMSGKGGIGEKRMRVSIQSKLREMNKDQLRTALDQIQALELGDDEKKGFYYMLFEPLAEKDPELLLNRFPAQFCDDEKLFGQNQMILNCSGVLGSWVKKDKTAAIAWFDKEIAAGTFESKSLDGKSEIRLLFETSVMTQLISTDPAAAGARISALPADQRKQALRGSEWLVIEESGQAAHADLVRTHLSEKDKYEVLGRQANMSIASRGSLEKLRAYLDRIGATGEERIKIVEKISDPKKRAEALENLQ